MNIDTGREFPFRNPRDDSEFYPVLPPGLKYTIHGNVLYGDQVKPVIRNRMLRCPYCKGFIMPR